jgi:hypothetical protein
MANPLKPIVSTAATLTLDLKTHAGAVVKMDKADGWVVTLPAAVGSGAAYKVYVGTSITTNTGIVAAAGTDIMQGAVGLATDAGGVSVPTTATSDKIGMNGGTTGGILGSWVEVTDVATGVWAVGGFLVSTGAEATPFSET